MEGFGGLSGGREEWEECPGEVGGGSGLRHGRGGPVGSGVAKSPQLVHQRGRGPLDARGFGHGVRFDLYTHGLERGDELPTIEEMRERHLGLRIEVLAGLAEVEDDAELYTARHGESEYWWTQHKRTSLDAYHRVVWHANSHTRQIWLIRGAIGARGTFPRQHYH